MGSEIVQELKKSRLQETLSKATEVKTFSNDLFIVKRLRKQPFSTARYPWEQDEVCYLYLHSGAWRDNQGANINNNKKPGSGTCCADKESGVTWERMRVVGEELSEVGYLNLDFSSCGWPWGIWGKSILAEEISHTKLLR